MRHPNLLAGEMLPGLPRQERSAAKRARILAAAEQLFSEHGYERVAIEDVARSAGVATGGVYLHFSSKKQLLKSLMADLVASLAAIELRIEGEGDNPREALRRLLRSAFATDLRFAGACRAWQEAALSDADVAKSDAELRAWSRARLRGLLEHLASLPAHRADVDVKTLADAVDRLFWTLIPETKRLTAAQRSRWVNAVSDLIHHALFRDDGRPSSGRRRR